MILILLNKSCKRGLDVRDVHARRKTRRSICWRRLIASDLLCSSVEGGLSAEYRKNLANAVSY
jgi:hypothetical protein